MDTRVTAAGRVEATLNYLAPGCDQPFIYAYAPPPGVPARAGESEARTITIHDARPLADALSLDVEGFALHRQPTAVGDFYDEGELRRVYYPETEALIRAATGAGHVVIFDHTLRNSAEGQRGQRIRETSTSVHNDYTERSAPKRVRDLLPEAEAEARLGRRYVEVNVWRPIEGPVLSWPLALCDARSLDAGDLVPSERRFPDRIGETYAVRYNPRHRWFYFPRMEREEAVLIKCFDSARDGRARLSVHTSFVDPTTPHGAPPRRSIELRAFAFF
jgi:hypothetical protein